jgi:putative membrane protein
MADFIAGVAAFLAYFAGATALSVIFGAIYLRLTPHRELDLVTREHNGSAALALGGTIVGYSIALAGAIHNTRSALEFLVWALLAIVPQLVALALARLAYPGLSKAIEQNALAAAAWQASISIAAGIVSAACMGP